VKGGCSIKGEAGNEIRKSSSLYAGPPHVEVYDIVIEEPLGLQVLKVQPCHLDRPQPIKPREYKLQVLRIGGSVYPMASNGLVLNRSDLPCTSPNPTFFHPYILLNEWV